MSEGTIAPGMLRDCKRPELRQRSKHRVQEPKGAIGAPADTKLL